MRAACRHLPKRPQAPAHVHVIGNGNEAVFKLLCDVNNVKLRENYGFNEKELSAILAALIEHKVALCGEWRKIHGDY
nr:DUF4160 domain-containing protein [Methylomonas paludis]